jgi:hypothetical protein
MGLIGSVAVSLAARATPPLSHHDIALHNADSTDKTTPVKENLCAASSIFVMHKKHA